MDQVIYTTSKFVQFDDGIYSRLMRHFVIRKCLLYKDKVVLKELKQKDFQGFKLIKSHFTNPNNISDDAIPVKEEMPLKDVERIEFNQGDSLSPFFSITLFGKGKHIIVPGYTDELRELCTKIEKIVGKDLLVNNPSEIVKKKSPPMKLIMLFGVLMILYTIFILLTKIF